MIIMSKTSALMFVTLSIIFIICTTSNAEKLTKDNKELMKKVSELLSSYQPTIATVNMRAESSIERDERFNRAIERAMEFVNVIGQLDNFINDKARVFLKRLNAMYEVDE